MLYHLSVDNLTVFVTVFINKRFLVLRHNSQRHTHAGEASVVIEILHRNLLRQIGEHHHTIVRAFIRTGITQRRHTIAEIIQTIEPLIPPPAVVKVGDWEIVLTRTPFSRP